MAEDNRGEVYKEPDPITYAHTVLCQAYLPYRNPGDAVRVWDRTNGRASLRVAAGHALHPKRGWVEIGLPYGPKPRLILAYLNTQALRTGRCEIDLDATLARFVRRLGLDDGGRTTIPVRDQLARIAAATLHLGVPTSDTTATTIHGQLVQEFTLWAPDGTERLLWPTWVRLDAGYFLNLAKHAVPLDERALAELAHSSVALDAYAWLAQRLRRVKPGKSALVPWSHLHQQFGPGYAQVRQFRAAFLTALAQVRGVYPAARVELDGRGLTLRESPPPVAPRLVQVSGMPPGSEGLTAD